MTKVFEKQIQIRFREADPARILYSGHLFNFAHDCFEEFIVAAGIPWKSWFSENSYFVPIRHVEMDFQSPFFPGETYSILASVAQIRDNSFQMHYRFHKNNKDHATLTMVHAFVDPKTMTKAAVPQEVREKLEPYLMQKKA